MKSDISIHSLDTVLKIGPGGAWGTSAPTDKTPVQTRCFRGIELHRLASASNIDPPVRWLSARQVESRRCTGGELLIEASGFNCGRSVLVNPRHINAFSEPVVYSNFCRRLEVLPGNDPLWAWACLRSSYATGAVDQHRIGTSIRNLDIAGYLSATFVAVPDIEEQKRISAIISTLDEKIESSRRLVTLLEEAATTMFRAGFVDFAGVTEFEGGEMGALPVGWKTGALTDLASFVNGKAFTKEANEQGRPILRIKELNDGVGESTPHTDIHVADEHLARHHDILFAWSGSLAVYRWSGPESVINQHIFKVVPAGYPPWFVYQWVRRHMAEFQAIARDKATTMGHIQRRHLTEAVVALPDPDTLTRATAILGPMDDWLSLLTLEIGSLREVRGALLPKLISGAIRVPDTADADEVIGPVADEVGTTS